MTAVALKGCTLCGEWSAAPLTVGDHHRICERCEQCLVKLDIEDPEYDLWVSALRRLWEDWNPSKSG